MSLGEFGSLHPLEKKLNESNANLNLIDAENLHKVYHRGSEKVVALRGVELKVSAGEFIVIIGPSGSGKSTLLHLLGGVDRPSEGMLQVNGVDLRAASEAGLTRFRRDNIGFVFQFYNLLPSLNALDNVILPLLAKNQNWKTARQRGEEMLAQVGLSHRQKHKPSQLSGGEQQRVAIARAIVVNPCIILADEPTGDLDTVSSESIVNLMVDINHRLGVTFVIATHNLHLVDVASRAYRMVDGRLGTYEPG